MTEHDARASDGAYSPPAVALIGSVTALTAGTIRIPVGGETCPPEGAWGYVDGSYCVLLPN